MKVFVILLSLGLVCSSSISQDFDQVADKFIDDVKTATSGLKSLKEHLGKPLSTALDTVEEDAKNYVSKVLKKHFNGIRNDASKILIKAEDLAQNSALHIKQLEEKLLRYGEDQLAVAKAGKRRVEKEINTVITNVLGTNGAKLEHDVDKVLKKATPKYIINVLVRELTKQQAIQDLRQWIENLPIEAEDDLEIPVKKLVTHLSDSDLAQLIKFVLNGKVSRSIWDIFEKIKNFFKDIGAKISDKFSSFKDWAADNWNKAIEAIKEKGGPYLALAKEFLGHAKDVSVQVAKQALEYFKAHKAEIAQAVFAKIVTAAKAAIASG